MEVRQKNLQKRSCLIPQSSAPSFVSIRVQAEFRHTQGLADQNHCLTASKSSTDITQYFDEILSETERSLLTTLIVHYHQGFDSSSAQIGNILKQMTELLTSADSPTTLAHADTMKLTEANLLKRQNNLNRRSKKKIPKANNTEAQPTDQTTSKIPQESNADSHSRRKPPRIPLHKRPQPTKPMQKASTQHIPPHTRMSYPTPHTPCSKLRHAPSYTNTCHMHHIRTNTTNNNYTGHVPGPTHGYNHALQHLSTLDVQHTSNTSQLSSVGRCCKACCSPINRPQPV